MGYDDQTWLINLSTTFLHGKVRLITHKATFVNIINKLIMSLTWKELSCQGTSEVFMSQGLQSIQNHTQVILWLTLII